MVVIFDKNLGRIEGADYRTFLDINLEPYKVTNDVNCHIDFILYSSLNRFVDLDTNAKTLHLIDLFHAYENQHQDILKKLRDPQTIVVSHMIHPELEHPRHVFVDFLFNRTKAYYSQFPFRPGTDPWYRYNTQQFVDFTLVPAEEKKKIFVSAGKTYKGTRIYRKKVFDTLVPYNNIGYLANYDDTGTFLYPHIEFPYIDNIEQIEQLTESLNYNWWGYCPPHNAYYQNTFISIYGETIEYGETLAVTEKTYDPLIKGHFILPFSNKGFVALLKSQGLLFPTFIDYTYDSIDDPDRRFSTYSDEVIRLMNMPLTTWQQEYVNNMDLLYHNKLWFHSRDYDRIDLENYKY